jgi:ABC-2 type transport system permease protein
VPAWLVVFSRELSDNWIGGKALYLILAFSILLGIETFVLATNFELSLFTPREMVFETLKSAIQVSLLIGLIIGADSISGERERATLEGLLLTPVSRRQIVLGKFLAALSAWPVALLITIPYMLLLSQGNAVFGPAVLWGALLGSLLAPAFTALGVLVSFWCNSNKTSFFVSLGIFLIFLLLGQVLGPTKTGIVGQLLQTLNPISAGFNFLSSVLVSNQNISAAWTSILAPLVFAVLAIGLLFYYVSPGLSIEAGRVQKLWSKMSQKIGLSVIACLLLSSSALPVNALKSTQSQAGALQLTMSVSSKSLKTGDSLPFDVVVTNTGAEESPAVIVAMNIINLDKEGDVVDPEDWSPQRTQYINSLAPGGSTTLSWQVNAVLDGNFMVYLVAIPEPESAETSSQIGASPGLHLTIVKFAKLNPGGVLPYAIGVPILLVLGIFLVFRWRRRQIDTGETQ